MAPIIGPTGGGQTIGSGGSFTGPAEALEVAGDFAYAYSGTFEATTAEQTALNFTTGNYLFVGELQLNAFLQIGNVSVRQGAAEITFNDTIVSLICTANGNEQAPLQATQELIIPPYTEVKVVIVAEVDDSDNFATVGITGRIYRD